MPLYEYKCTDCGEIIEFRSTYEKKGEIVSSLKCEKCDSKEFTQVFSGISLTGAKSEPSAPSTGSCCAGGMCNF